MTPDLVLESSLKISCILLVALLATAVLRKRSAALRHWILTAAILCAAAAPVLERLLPAWQVPELLSSVPGSLVVSLSNHEQPGSFFDGLRTSVTGASSVSDRAPSSVAAARAGNLWGSSVAQRVWLGGVLLSLLTLIAGLGHLAWIASRARLVQCGDWARIADEAAREYGLRRPVRLLRCNHATLVVTWGFLRPIVVMPRTSEQWTADRMRVVLLHELAHVKRGDWLIQMAAEIVRAVCWFNPLVWIACRRLRQESEHAADDAVLSRGISGQAYATELLELARAFSRHRQSWLPAPAIARPSSLERRVTAMLNARVNRRPATRLVRGTIFGALSALAVAIASAQGVFSSFSGTVYDPLNGFLPDVKMVLTHTQTGAKYEIRSDPNGRFQFVGLPPGQYALQTELLGFMPLHGTLDIGGQDVQRDVRLQIGSLRETVSVRSSGPGVAVPESSWRASQPLPESRCMPAEAGGGMGGNIRPPTKLVHVAPRYPSSLSVAGQGGTVVLDARIGTDGAIRDVRAISSPHPDLELAATDAVRQWEFSQTLLNCVAVDVAMKVTVNFIVE